MEKSDFEYMLKFNSFIDITIDDDGDSDTYEGVVVSLSDTFVVIIETDDFQADGLTIIPINRIEKFECGQRERTKKRILKFNGLEIDNNYSWLNLSSYEDLFRIIQNSGKSIYVSSNETGEAGYVSSSEKNTLLMRAYNTSGIQSEDPAVIAYKNIYAFCIGDRYSTVLCKYAESLKS